MCRADTYTGSQIQYRQCRDVCLKEGETFDYIQITTSGSDGWDSDYVSIHHFQLNDHLVFWFFNLLKKHRAKFHPFNVSDSNLLVQVLFCKKIQQRKQCQLEKFSSEPEKKAHPL